MHSSTSNSSSSNGNSDWWKLLISGCAIAILTIHGFQAYLSLQGYSSWVSDSKELWGAHMERVRWINNPIVLAGGSRMQLDVSVEELEHLTRRNVVQLAIDGQGGMPILKYFADEKLFKGTLIISIQESELLLKPVVSGRIKEWLGNYKSRHAGTVAPNVEAYLQALFQLMYSYHSIEMDPFTLLNRLITGAPAITYLKTDINRDRFADYWKVPLADFYVGRVIRHLGYSPKLPNSLTLMQFNKLITEECKKIIPFKKDNLRRNINNVRAMVEELENHGITVVILRMPTDKLILEIDNARSQHSKIWSEMRKAGIKTLHFSEIPDINKFDLPDGSHMDQSQKAGFTRILTRTLRLRGWL